MQCVRRPLRLKFFQAPEVHVVFEERAPTGLVFAGSSGRDLRIDSVVPGTQAASMSMLRAGLMLKAVDDKNVTRATRPPAASYLVTLDSWYRGCFWDRVSQL